MSEFKKVENAKAELTVTCDGERWQKAQDKAFKKLARNLTVKGFRKGAAPVAIARKEISEGQILYTASEDDDLWNEMLREGVEEHKVEMIDTPKIKSFEKLDKDAFTIVFELPVYPDVEIEDYKGLGWNGEEAVVTDEEVQQQIDSFRESKAELELKEEGKAENGDIVEIDYVGTIDGETFDGGSAENYELTLGSGSFIPGFEDQLIGVGSEEEKDVVVTFPEDYHATELAGKEAKFHVTVHEVKTKVLPELEPELIDELQIPDVHDEAALRKYIYDNMLEQKKEENERKARNEMLEKLGEKAKIEIPDVLIVEEAKGMINQYENQWRQQMGQDFSFNKEMMDSLIDSFRGEAEKRVRNGLILKEIARKENVEVSDEEIEEEFKRLAERFKMDVESVKMSFPVEFLRSDLMDRKTFELLK